MAEHEDAPAYARAGVDQAQADAAVAGLVEVLASIEGIGPTLVPAGHYAAVVALDAATGIALTTDGVGTKVIVAQQLGVYDTVGIDCVAMNVNDLICVGARPLALVDYLAVEQADPAVLRELGLGLKAGAERAGVAIPGGEVAQLPEVIRGSPSPHGFDLAGAAFGTVALDALVTGARCEPGDVVIGLPSSGIHSNGLTLARRVLTERAGLGLEEHVEELGRTLGEELLEPTAIYVKAVMELLGSGLDVRGLAHITSGGSSNLLRLEAEVGYELSDPLPEPPLFDLIRHHGGLEEEEMRTVFNLGTGFCCVLAAADAEAAAELLAAHHLGARAIGLVTARPGSVEGPG